MLTESLQIKLDRMQTLIRSFKIAAVAFSGGADSTLVLKVALEALGSNNVLAVTGRSDSLAFAELQGACQLAKLMGVRHELLDTREFEDDHYLSNPVNRCYYCKTALYEAMKPLMVQHCIEVILNGLNADDLGDWRPGTQAAQEHTVRSPAMEAGLTKAEVRLLLEYYGLPNFNKPASPCLSSRVQYGEPITPQKLRQIEQAESFLRSLGLGQFRVRHHDNLARVELLPEDISRVVTAGLAPRIDAHLRELGYTYVTLDLRGFRSGSMNEAVALPILPQTPSRIF